MISTPLLVKAIVGFQLRHQLRGNGLARFTHSADVVGQEIIAAGLYSLQGSRGQQGLAAVQFNRNALSEGNVFQFNGNSVFQATASMSNTSTLDAAAMSSRQRSDGQ